MRFQTRSLFALGTESSEDGSVSYELFWYETTSAFTSCCTGFFVRVLWRGGYKEL